MSGLADFEKNFNKLMDKKSQISESLLVKSGSEQLLDSQQYFFQNDCKDGIDDVGMMMGNGSAGSQKRNQWWANINKVD